MNSTIEKLEAAQNELNSVEQTHRGAWAHGMALRHLWAEREEEILHLLSEQGMPDVMNPTSDAGWLLAYASSPMTSRLPALKAMYDISEASTQFRDSCKIIGPIMDLIAKLEAEAQAESHEYALKLRAIADAEEVAMAKALLEWETIDGEQLDDIIAGKEPRPPKDWTPRNPSVGPATGAGGPSGGTPAINPDPTPTAAKVDL